MKKQDYPTWPYWRWDGRCFRRFWILERQEGGGGGGGWLALPAVCNDPALADVEKIPGATPEPAAIRGGRRWDLTLATELGTIYPLTEEGYMNCSPTRGLVVVGAQTRGPAPAFAQETGHFVLCEERGANQDHPSAVSTFIYSAGLWPSYTREVSG